MTSPGIAEFWDSYAPTYDQEPDHGLADPRTRAAWAGRLREWLPGEPADVLDLGCGTGSLGVLAAAQGHRVTGVDLAPEMVRRARAKGVAAIVGDASAPPVRSRSVDVVLARHLAWTLPDPHAALARWVGLVRPGGRLVLVEGRWGASGYVEAPLPWAGGVRARDLLAAVTPLVRQARVEALTDAVLWGKEITDERYVLRADV
jgi:SAM-dependent methyltransferase